jgi:hypothetical protein
MQVALIASCSEGRLARLLALLDDRKVKLDAVYIRHNFPEERHMLNYAQVLTEFNVVETAHDRVLVISSILLENAEIEQRNGLQLVYEPSASLGRRWTR